MTQIRFAALGDVCAITTGGTPARTRRDFFGGGIPWVKIGDMVDGVVCTTEETISQAGIEGSSAKLFSRGTVLVSIFATIGRTAILEIDAATNQAIAGITPHDSLDSAYLRYFLDSKHSELNALARGVAQPNINQKILKSLRIPLPPMAEQRRLVDLLSRAEGIVRLRREAQRKAAELIPAIFLDLFGDPATNSKHWLVVPLGDLVERFEGGKNIQAGDEGVSAFRILRISAVTSGHYIESESKPVPEGFSPPASYFVRKGDLLFSRANTEALVGATALVEDTNGTTLLPDKLWRFVWRADVKVTPAFMLHFLQQSATRKLLSQLASGTGGSMKNISQAKLKTLPVAVPPVGLQRQFAVKAEAVRGIIARQTDALATAQAAFDALLHQAFA